MKLTPVLFILLLVAAIFSPQAHADVTIEFSDAIKKVVDPNTQGQIQDLVNAGLRKRAQDNADARDLLASNQTIKIICFGEPKAAELGIKPPEGPGMIFGGFGDTRGDFDANGKPKPGGTVYIGIDCDRLRQLGWFKSFEHDIEKQTMWVVLVHELLHASNRSHVHSPEEDQDVYKRWVEAFNATLLEELRRAEQPPRRRRQAKAAESEHSLLVPKSDAPAGSGAADVGMLAQGVAPSCNTPAAEVTVAGGDQRFNLSGSGYIFIDPQKLAALSAAGIDGVRFEVNGHVSDVSAPPESQGAAVKVAVTHDLSSLPLLSHAPGASAPDLAVNVGGLWSDLDAKTTPVVTQTQQNGTFRLEDIQFTIGSTITRTTSGEDSVVGSSIILMIPTVHIDEKSNPEIPLLPFWVPSGPGWEKYRKDPLEKITSHRQVLIDAKIYQASSQEIDWWPADMLDEAIKKIPESGAVSSFDTSLLQPFSKFGATDVSSFLALPDCLAAFSSGALHTEADGENRVAPAPGLDPVDWPSSTPRAVVISLEEQPR